MKSVLHFIMAVVLNHLSFFANAQFCDPGGCSNMNKQFPAGTFSTTSSTWQVVRTTMNGGNYTIFDVTQGNTYEWSTCNDFGGSQNWNAELTLKDGSNSDICYNNNSGRTNCPNAPYIGWTATYTGQVKLLISESSCQNNGPSAPFSTLVWRMSAAGTGSGSVNVTLAPQGAINDGAQWNLDGGNWQSSATTLNSVSAGSHIIYFKTISGWTTPATKNITVVTSQTTYISETYGTIQYGTVTVNISPFAAVNDGAQWNLDGGSWQNSGNYLYNIQTGSHAIYFKNIPNWNAPSSQGITIYISQTTTLNEIYSQLQYGSVSVTLSPLAAINDGAQWNLDGGSWQNSANTLSNVGTGSHQIGFKSITGWNTPSGKNITVYYNQTATLNEVYTQGTQFGSVIVNISPPAAVSAGAQWNIDGGSWQNSSNIVNNISTGSHTVNFNTVTGWNSPVSQNISVSTSQTTTISGTYTQSSNTTYWIGFYNSVKGNQYYQTEKLIASGTSLQTSPTAAKICADGSNSTIVKVNCDNPTLNMKNIRLRIKDGGTLVYEGEFDTSNSLSTFSIAAIRYRHPEIMELTNKPFKQLKFEAYNIADPGKALITYPIEIYKAPVLMVHGLWGAPSVFNEMHQELVNVQLYPEHPMCLGYSALIFAIDYEETHDASFLNNSKNVATGINSLLGTVRGQNYSAGKVDIVAHSMGGLLSRIYFENLHGNLFRNDIHKFITLNTPHSGAQTANVLWYFDTILCSIVRYSMNKKVGCPLAIENMRAKSLDMQKLNDPQHLDNELIPTFSIITFDDDINDYQNCLNLITMMLPFLSDRNFLYASKEEYLDTIFNNEGNDLIVPVSSQKGGISKFYLYINQCHMGSTRNNAIISKVKQLLCDPPNANYFDLDGFSPPDIKVPQDKYYKTDRFHLAENVKIELPIAQSSFTSGETIYITTAGDSLIHLFGIYIAGEEIKPFGKLTTSANGTHFYTIPPEAAGEISIQIIGLDSLGNLSTDAITINAVPAASLTGLSYYPLKHFIPKGGKAHTTIYGNFDDGIKRNLSNNSGLTISTLDPGILNVTEGHMLQSFDTGSTVAHYSYLWHTVDVPIEVYQGEDWLVNNEGVGVSEDLEIKSGPDIIVYPNPSSGIFTFSYNISRPGNVRIDIYNSVGQKVVSQSTYEFPGQQERKIDLNNFAPGLYYYQAEGEPFFNTGKLLLFREN